MVMIYNSFFNVGNAVNRLKSIMIIRLARTTAVDDDGTGSTAVKSQKIKSANKF